MKLNKSNIEEILKAMNLEEKVYLCVGGAGFSTKAIDRLGIPSLNLYDGHNGITVTQMLGTLVPKVIDKMPKDDGSLRFMSDGIMKILFAIGKVLGESAIYDMLRKSITDEQLAMLPEEAGVFCKNFMDNVDSALPHGLPTCFPSGIGMGATWNPELIGELAERVGEEARVYDVDVLLGPNVNIHRDPLGGRNFESFSEDPLLSSKTVVGYINGMQKSGTAACVKHYACNNQETNRHEVNEIISRRALEEIYLPSFKAAITEAKSRTLMTAYNYVNGTACSENKFLVKDVLRDLWGFDGVVVSDWNGVYNKVNALNATSDLEMPGPTDQQEIIDGVNNGVIKINEIDDRVRRILELIVTSNIFRDEKVEFIRNDSIQIAYKAAVESIVMLKNNKSVLPLRKKETKIALFGDGAKDSLSTGAGSAGVASDYVVSTKEGLESYFSNIAYTSSSDISNDLLDKLSDNFEYAVIHVNKMTGEGKDIKSMDLVESDVEMIKHVSSFFKTKKKKSIVIINAYGPVEIQSWDENIDAILHIWYPGQELGRAVSDIISGKENPSGKLPVTFPAKYIDAPTSHSFPGEHLESVYGEGIYVGYRYYDVKDVQPLYEFGFGLSYSEFVFREAIVNKEVFKYEETENVEVSFTITNNSTVNGYETAQLYVQDNISKFKRPIRELKAFKKIFIKAGEEVSVNMKLTKDAFSYYDTGKDQWVIEPGDFTLYIGSSSRNLPLTIELAVEGPDPYGLSLDTPISDIYTDEKILSILTKYIPEQLLQLPGIQVELIYHPELSLGEAWNKYFEKALQNAGMSSEQTDDIFTNMCTALNASS